MSFTIPGWVKEAVLAALRAAGRAAASALCQRYLGDPTCYGLI